MNHEEKNLLKSEPLFIKEANFYKIFTSVLDRIIRLLGAFTRHRKKRYVQLTPSTFTSQLILDRKNYSIIKLRVRDKIDLGTMRQVFLSDDYGLNKLKRHKELAHYYKSIVQSGMKPLIIDCGGNIGLASRYFSENYPETKVICIEPESNNIKQAKINNHDSNIVFFESAIGSSVGSGNLHDPGLGNNAFQMQLDTQGETRIISVNHLLEIYNESEYIPFIIKIDIEGFEDELFSANTEWVQKFPILIIELHDWMLPKQGNSSNFLKIISAQNRDFLFFGENVYSIRNDLPLINQEN